MPSVKLEPLKDPKDAARCFLHTDFDQWEPDLMLDCSVKSKDKKRGRFQIHRMLPQSATLYFYSYGGIPFVDKKQPTVKIDDVIK